MWLACLWAAVALVLQASALPPPGHRLPPHLLFKRGPYLAVPPGRPSSNDCTEHFLQQPVDHFAHDPAGGSFRERYFTYDKYWRRDTEPKGPIFFYVGNEADVTLYINATGLMWESAENFGALLVFAEHRYYGKSEVVPHSRDGVGGSTPAERGRRMRYLSTEQALADYARLIYTLKEELGAGSSAVVGFGGSYGGMLATWLRVKYPSAIDGAIAGSAPIWSFRGEVPASDTGSYAKGVTFDATPAGGAAAACAPNLRAAWKEILGARAATPGGRESLARAFNLCPYSEEKLTSHRSAVWDLAFWLQGAFDYMAMGNYPYASSYILNGAGTLPAYPMRVACEHLAEPGLSGGALLSGLREAAGTFYNHSGARACFNFTEGVNEQTAKDANYWGYQWCTEMAQPMSRDGVQDAFWPQPWNATAAAQGCLEQWGVAPDPLWATIQYGGRHLEAASNLVLSNGQLDPWAGGGVLESVSDTVLAVVIEGGAHHLDLFWSHPLDPKSVLAARATERLHMRKWVDQAEARAAGRGSKR